MFINFSQIDEFAPFERLTKIETVPRPGKRFEQVLPIHFNNGSFIWCYSLLSSKTRCTVVACDFEQVAKASLTSIQGVELQTYFDSYISHNDLQGMSVWEDLSSCVGVLMLIDF